MTTLQEAHKFLLGEGPIDGVWFGDNHPTERGAFWWRKHLRAALEGADRVGWQPIETAPKDFVTEFDGWNGERVTNVSWAHPEYSSKGHYAWCVSEYEHHNGWVNTEVKGLTHWRTLPPAPKESK